MVEINCNSFELLNKINVNDHIEKKGGFSYLSWPYAVAELRKNFPDAHWETKRFDGFPYLKTPLGYFVEVECTVNGLTLSQIHPVLDNRNQPIKEPNPMQINTSIQRATVKAMALHGLGLYIYAGEDLPLEDEQSHETNKNPVQIAQQQQVVQTPAKKESYVAKAVQQLKDVEEKRVVTPVSKEELRELFGDDIEIVEVDDEPELNQLIGEAELKRIKGKIQGTKPKDGKDYGTIYKWIADVAGITVKTKDDLPKIPFQKYSEIAKLLDSKVNHFEIAS
ncbi:Single-strand annealing protein SAK3 [uncultured Caudovirales phage]|uniref:Single-strand annealing protein SAK3 n=1 Tax=uncultured Caudovirales phage TaxID=2100421 RepID=A0A6J7WLQ0_9CAUD|nr:Single-strand annealing protein SAK3 [uncultured Caudovirales phage]CAB5216980.1 Single-strand annealing protein SAK3 [uncultured Caudovirales phage]